MKLFFRLASSRSLSKISPFSSKQDTSVARRGPVRPVWAYFPDNDRRSIIPLNVNITLHVEGKIALFVITILCCCIFRDPHRYLSLLLSWEPDLSLWELSSHWLPPNSNPGYRSFYTAEPVLSQLGTPGDFIFLSQVSCVKARGSNPPFVTAQAFLVHWGRRGCARSL